MDSSFLLSFSLLIVSLFLFFFFFNDTATTEIYTLSLHDALPICNLAWAIDENETVGFQTNHAFEGASLGDAIDRSEEHTSELQSQSNLVCRLLLEKKKKKKKIR